MKRILIVATVIIMALGFVSCAEQTPDPVTAINEYLDSYKGADGKAAAILLGSESVQRAIADYPELGELFEKAASEYVRNMEFIVDESESIVDEKAGVATFAVILNTLDYESLVYTTEQQLDEWIDDFVTSGEFIYPTDEEQLTKNAELLVEIMQQQQIERVNFKYSIDLKFDKKTNTWNVTNPDEIMKNFAFMR